MTLLASSILAAERAPLPDFMTRAGVEFLVSRARRRLAVVSDTQEAAFAESMREFPIAAHTDEANAQHYEVPAAFFERVLGPRRKYSCCLYADATTTLAQAEVLALAASVEHAAIENGQSILELGCGWGSLSLYMAEKFPNSRIVSVSNSNSQREYIVGEAARLGFANLEVITADMNIFSTLDKFDRIVSIEMFEHMSNWRMLLERAHSWLADKGKLFIHVFTHKNQPYRFDHADRTDWIAQHFFTGGIMPSHGLIGRFPDLFTVEEEWRWNGRHYERTALDWLANFDAHSKEISQIMRDVYGDDAKLWTRRWRLFFFATAGLFGHANGEEWGVSHYRLSRV